MVQYRPQKRTRVQEQQLLSVLTLGKPGCPADFEGPFRSNIRSFVHDFARGPCTTAPSLTLPGVRAWTLQLRSERDDVLSLYILEETPQLSHNLHCDRCRVLGWALHPVCQRRYHFIIGSTDFEESTGVGKGRKLCLGCNRIVPASTKICGGCGADATKNKILEARTHLLHGIIHANGYGHLLRVNGREGGSNVLSGREIMDLWDRLCTMLRARKVSVMDVSKKHNLEFRLLHAVAYGNCWYGLWGYAFGRGSFGISEWEYTQAIQALSNATLRSVVSRFDRRLSSIVSSYRNLSKAPISTVRDLMRFMMLLLQKLQKEALAEKGREGIIEKPVNLPRAPPAPTLEIVRSRWPAKRLLQAQDALIKILRSTPNATWLTRHILREDARSQIGDTGLLDFVLKGFVNKIVQSEIVRRRVNEGTRTLEYRLEHNNGEALDDQTADPLGADFRAVTAPPPPVYAEVVDDLTFVYRSVLESYNPAKMVNASRIMLDVRQFIKDYKGEFNRDKFDRKNTRDESYRVLCELEGENIPAELVVLSRETATVGDLKQNVAKAFRDVYLSFAKFEVVSIPALEGAGDDHKLSAHFLDQQVSLVVQGSGVDQSSAARYERGPDQWIVDCQCGTKDDDGERMTECDACETWHHTRCAGIHDGDPVPQHFLCSFCNIDNAG